MKTLLRVLGVIAALIVIGIAIVFYGSSGMVDASDAFFKAVAAGNMQEARGYLSEDFRKATPDDELRAYIERSALLDYAEGHWSSRQINLGGTGHLEGAITTKTGGHVPLSLSFVKENDAWKIYSIRKSQAGLITETEGQATPSQAEMRKIALATTLAFVRAIKTGEFAEIYQTTAPELQKKYTTAAFAANFSSMVDSKPDVVIAEDTTPTFTATPEMLEDGVLHMKGFFVYGDQEHLNFDYKYVYRYTQWTLLYINVRIATPKKTATKSG